MIHVLSEDSMKTWWHLTKSVPCCTFGTDSTFRTKRNNTEMAHVAASKVRQDFADTLNRVAYGKQRVVLERRGKEIAAVIPIEDLRLLEALEDRIDLADARTALAEAKKKGTKSLDVIMKKLGL